MARHTPHPESPAQAPSEASPPADRGAVLRDVAVLVALLLLVGGVAELAFRSVVPRLSANSRVLAAAPERAARIRDAERPTVLVLGNSISGEGIDATLLSDGLAARGLDLHIEHQPADTTVARDWYFELKNHYLRAGAHPDWIVLPVGDSYPLTRVNERTEDLLFSFVRWADLPELLAARPQERDGRAQTQATERFEDTLGTVAAKAVSLYGFRGRVQKRVLVGLVPNYEEMRLEMRLAGTQLGGQDRVTADVTWAEKLAQSARDVGAEVVVVAMPTEPLEARLPEADHAIAERLGWHVLEPGAGETWTQEDRPDGLHLSPPARARLTDLLAARLADLIGADAP